MTTSLMKPEQARPSAPVPVPEFVKAAPESPPAPLIDPLAPEEHWGDRVALYVWIMATLILVALLTFDFLAGLWPR